jgi:HTH-type transcriptional regulator/antitoxin HigA
MATDPKDYRTPGQYILALLEERGWTQRVLAAVLGIGYTTLNKVVRGDRSIDAALAIQLGEAFGAAPANFLKLQVGYDLAIARAVSRPDPGRATRAHLYQSLPVAEMSSRGWLGETDVNDIGSAESALAKFFGVESSDQIEILPHAAKRTAVAEDVSPTQLAWLYRVREIARDAVVPPYSTHALTNAIAAFRPLLASVEGARHVPRLLAEAGVRFVVVESLTGAKIDGVCFWLDDRSPVSGLSMRHDRIDNFWFVLRHECEHVLRGHGRSIVALDAELERDRAGTGEGVAEIERVANEAAQNFCVPAKTMQQFIARKAPLFTERDILGFAKTLQVHPGLVAGQLQHRTGRYERFRTHLAKVRSVVLPNVLHDGWGDVAPVGSLT